MKKYILRSISLFQDMEGENVETNFGALDAKTDLIP